MTSTDMSHRGRPPMVLLIAGAFFLGFAPAFAIGSLGKQTEDPARADEFWTAVYVNAVQGRHFEGIDDAVQASDAIVVGRMLRVDAGRQWVASEDVTDPRHMDEGSMARFAAVTLEVVETLKEEPETTQSQLELEIFLPTSDSLELLRANMPRGEALYLLHRKRDSDDKPRYRLLSLTGAYFLNDDGVSRALPSLTNSLMSDLDGISFGALVELVRMAAMDA